MALPEEVQRRVSKIESLATLPSIAAEILDILRSSRSGMREIARVVERDPSITAKILKVANSPLWGFQGRVDNVQRALILLGLKQVTNIVIAVSLYSSFSRLKPNPYFDREKFWLHSAGTGQIARAFTQKLGVHFHGEEFVAALIHDVGKMVFDQFFSTEFQEILLAAKQNGKRIYDIEYDKLGCTHADVGSWLLAKWNFPDTIVDAVQYHHDPQKALENQDLAAVIHLSELFCEMWGIGFDEDVKQVCFEDNLGWHILRKSYPQLMKIDIERFTFELNLEIEKAQLFIELIKD